MNAKESINHLKHMADYWTKIANHPQYYNSEGSHYLAMAAQALYQETANIESIFDKWGTPKIDGGVL